MPHLRWPQEIRLCQRRKLRPVTLVTVRVWWLLLLLLMLMVSVKMMWKLVEMVAIRAMETAATDTAAKTTQTRRALNLVHRKSTALVTLHVQHEVGRERIDGDALRGGGFWGRTSGGNAEGGTGGIDWREFPVTGCTDKAIDGIDVALFDSMGIHGPSLVLDYDRI